MGLPRELPEVRSQGLFFSGPVPGKGRNGVEWRLDAESYDGGDIYRALTLGGALL